MSQRIYYGGNILTMDKDETSDYLITENGKIKNLGKGTPPPLPVSAERYDLKGRTLMPAFMDPHSHISGCAARFLQVPLESCKTNEEIKSALETFLSQAALKAGEWIFACGYDSGRIKGRRLTAEFLDKIVPEHPLVVQYQSGHMGIFNSAAMKILGVDKNTPSAEGGFIEKAEDGTPTGYMEEADFVSRLKNIPMPGGEKLLNAFTRARARRRQWRAGRRAGRARRKGAPSPLPRTRRGGQTPHGRRSVPRYPRFRSLFRGLSGQGEKL